MSLHRLVLLLTLPLICAASRTDAEITASDGVPGDFFGSSVSGAGDVNSDGYGDVIVGAHSDLVSGAAYVYLGSATGIDLGAETKLTASDGVPDIQFGFSVSSAGNVNGDAYDDVIVGALGGSGPGAAYVYLGGSDGVDRATEIGLAASDGEPFDAFGISVSAAGDVNADGYGDVIIGAHLAVDQGAAYVYLGGPSDFVDEARLTASDGASSDRFAESVSWAGDVDSDGYDDVIVGARHDDDLGTNSGSVYLYRGSVDGIDPSSQTRLTASDGTEGAEYGVSVSGAGDVDSDGYDDVIVGAWLHDAHGPFSGTAYVYRGGPLGIDAASEIALAASDGSECDYLGISVSAAGDVDDDGFDDVVAGAHGYNQAGADLSLAPGALYLFHGAGGGIGAETRVVDPAGGDFDMLGYAVSGAGDVDQDGKDDVIAGTDSESAHIYRGGSIALSIGGVCPGTVEIQVTNATPLGSVALLTSPHAGASVLPGGPCAGHTTDLGGSLTLRTVTTASASGDKTLSPTLAAGACGVSVQVLDVATCTLTSVETL